MMRFSGVCSAIVLVVFSTLAQAEQAGWALFDKVQLAVRQYNFDTSFVVLKGGKADTYRWLHGRDGSQLECSSLGTLASKVHGLPMYWHRLAQK